MNTKQKGEVSEAKVLSFLSERDVDVFLPFGENVRADMIVLEEHRPERIQIKTGRIKNGSIRFSCSKINSNRSGSTRTNYEGQIDAFIVYCPDNEGYYYVPIEEANKTNMWLRVDESMADNGKVKWADEYQLSDVYEKLEF
jgi:hypothetical protein